jgi:DNA-binding transcriptional ArsR family regulator
MLRIHFTADDIARTTVAANTDPLWEVVLSNFRLHDRDRPPAYRAWRQHLRDNQTPQAVAGARLLSVIAPMGPYFPDFLTPYEARHGLEDGLEALMGTPRRELQGQLARLSSISSLPSWTASLASGQTETLARVSATLRAYSEAVITPHRNVIQVTVAADHAHRLRQLTSGGLEKLFESLRPIMRWNSPVLEVSYVNDRDLYLNGRGLRLVPSYFCGTRPVALADPALPPTLAYPIAAEYHWADTVRSGTAALDALLGRTRAAVLRTVSIGATTTELARLLDTSLASASRHASILRNAGLVISHRYGTSVLHALTPLGEDLLHASGDVPSDAKRLQRDTKTFT